MTRFTSNPYELQILAKGRDLPTAPLQSSSSLRRSTVAPLRLRQTTMRRWQTSWTET